MIRDFMTEPDEKVTCEYRRHWINVFAPMFSALLLGLAVVAGFYFLGLYGNRLPAGTAGLGSLVLLFMLICAMGIALLALWIYNQNRIYLTNYHLLVVQQNGLFNRKVSQLSLAKIQDVSVSKKGPLAMMLGYGTLTIETAGEEENFEFYQLADPYGMSRQIMQAHDAAAHRPDGVSDSGVSQPQPAAQVESED